MLLLLQYILLNYQNGVENHTNYDYLWSISGDFAKFKPLEFEKSAVRSLGGVTNQAQLQMVALTTGLIAIVKKILDLYTN